MVSKLRSPLRVDEGAHLATGRVSVRCGLMPQLPCRAAVRPHPTPRLSRRGRPKAAVRSAPIKCLLCVHPSRSTAELHAPISAVGWCRHRGLLCKPSHRSLRSLGFHSDRGGRRKGAIWAAQHRNRRISRSLPFSSQAVTFQALHKGPLALTKLHRAWASRHLGYSCSHRWSRLCEQRDTTRPSQ